MSPEWARAPRPPWGVPALPREPPRQGGRAGSEGFPGGPVPRGVAADPGEPATSFSGGHTAGWGLSTSSPSRTSLAQNQPPPPRETGAGTGHRCARPAAGGGGRGSRGVQHWTAPTHRPGLPGPGLVWSREFPQPSPAATAGPRGAAGLGPPLGARTALPKLGRGPGLQAARVGRRGAGRPCARGGTGPAGWRGPGLRLVVGGLCAQPEPRAQVPASV